ncbi:MAG TPA: hypothetical protein VNW47_07540 [Terriglobales bacterium]|jgi:hypothetical protein|nr:hypothetical protein [Terriglobales bacterium]
MIERTPPFFGNKPDDNHCVQAAVLIVLNTLGFNKGWRFVEECTGYEDRRWTWYPTAAVAMNHLVPGTKVISTMDYRQFAARGEEFFREHNINQPGWFDIQKEHASEGFRNEQTAAKTLIAAGHFELRRLTLPNVERLLIDYFLIALVDSGLLAREGSTSAHSVVVYASEGDVFVLHDPGLPRRPALRVEKSVFMAAFKHELIAVPRDYRKQNTREMK